MYTFSFERLDVWKNSRDLTKHIYQITQTFPGEEKYGLVSQLRRASVSIISNIAEGSSRSSVKDQAHFYNTAFSSLMEVLNQVIISNELEYISTDNYSELRKLIEKISNQLNSLRNSILTKISCND